MIYKITYNNYFKNNKHIFGGNMNMINSEIFLKEKIQDKKIAIIGPADYVNKELPDTHGKYIDENFD